MSISKEAPMRLISYDRVSSAKQADSGHSLDLQPAFIERWCDERGYELVGSISDGATSGGTVFSSRPGGAMLIERLKAGEADGMVVLNFDRAFRKAVDGLTQAQWFYKNYHSVWSVQQPYDIGTDEGWMMFGISMLSAENELRRVSKRNKATTEHLRRTQQVFGPVPFGLVSVDGQLKLDERNWAVRKRIVEMKRALSYAKLARWCRDEDILSPTGRKKWSKSTLQNMVNTHHLYDNYEVA